MTTADVGDQYAQMGSVAGHPLQMMYMQAGMDPSMGGQYPQMMMPQDPSMGGQYPQMMMPQMQQSQMMAMQAAQMNPQMMAMQAQMNPAQMAAMQGMGDATGFNSKGLPIRVGTQVCQFFLKTGDCKFGPACKWDHSETAETSAAMYGGMGGMGGMGQGMMAAIPAMTPGGNNGSHNSLGYPLRPAQQACGFFSKTGTCSYGASCKWDHPEEYCALSVNHPNGPPPIPTPSKMEPPSGFNSLGYPIRSGQQACAFFLKTGSCSYGMNCKWDHPEGLGGSQPGGYRKAGPPGGQARMGPY